MRTHRTKLTMSQEVLRSLLYLPADSFIYGADYNLDSANITFHFTTMEADVVPEGGSDREFSHWDYYTKDIK